MPLALTPEALRPTAAAVAAWHRNETRAGWAGALLGMTLWLGLLLVGANTYRATSPSTSVADAVVWWAGMVLPGLLVTAAGAKCCALAYERWVPHPYDPLWARAQ